MLKIALCDDAPVYIDTIQKMLEEWETEKSFPVTVDGFESGDSLLKSLSKDSYDIILLDIMMPMITGLDIAAEIRKADSSVKIIFISSSSEFGVQSYSVKASNYLLKPINKAQLFSALDEVADEILKEPKSLTFKSGGMIHKIPIQDIEYVEAQDKYIFIYTAHQGPIKVLEPMYQVEQRLPLGSDFLKCHRSYIVNLHYVKSFNAKEIEMLSGNLVPISRKHANEFQEAFFAFAFEDDQGV